MYILFTAILAVFIVFCVVYPLWYFATAASDLYTIILITIAILLALFFFCRKIWRRYSSFKDTDTRHRYFLKLFLTLLGVILILLTLFLSVRYVLSEQRLTALFIFISGVLLTTLCFKFRKRHSDV